MPCLSSGTLPTSSLSAPFVENTQVSSFSPFFDTSVKFTNSSRTFQSYVDLMDVPRNIPRSAGIRRISIESTGITLLITLAIDPHALAGLRIVLQLLTIGLMTQWKRWKKKSKFHNIQTILRNIYIYIIYVRTRALTYDGYVV